MGKCSGNISDPFLAIEKFNKNAKLFAYNEVRERCLLTELHKKENLHDPASWKNRIR